ncbi:MAG TPA: dephospho-CoA kinase [Actinomycetota bacterium]|jgi:dephospho-CoA kinase
MLLVGLTGGIGSGKSTFAALLAERGAQIVDADVLGHDALEPGEPAWHSVVDQFGDEILSPGTMRIDRKRLAAIVFESDHKRAALNAIVHPEIFRRMADAIDRLRATDAVVVIDAALIFETGLADSCDVIVVVTSTTGSRTERLVRSRGMSIDQITARMAAQADPAALVQKADIVVRNDGSLQDLAHEADRVWTELELRKLGKP